MDKNSCLKCLYSVYIMSKNALLAIKVSEMLNVPVDIVRLALQDFKAVGRRCEIICQYNDNIVLNDYAHHPTEIHCCLQALKTRYKMPILCIFQPHTYSRTKLLLKQFLKVLKEADDLIIFKEYPARESKQMGFSAKISLQNNQITENKCQILFKQI